MADFSLYGDGQFLRPGTVTSAANGYGVSVTPGNGAEGSWVELLSNTASPIPSQGFYLGIHRTGNGSWDANYDIAIGGAGSEQVIVSDMNQCSTGNGLEAENIFFPIAIPALTRVAIRGYGGSSGVTTVCMLHLLQGGSSVASALTGATGLGVSGAGAAGLTAGTSSEGSWVEIVASTARHYRGLMIRGASNDAIISAASLLVDVAIGGSGSEVAILSDVQFRTQTSVCSTGYYPIHIPAGVRLAVRAQGSAARAFELSILAFY